MRHLLRNAEGEIPLGQALFVVAEKTRGAQMIPELMIYQTDGRLFDTEGLDEDIFDQELPSFLDELREFLKSNPEGGIPS